MYSYSYFIYTEISKDMNIIAYGKNKTLLLGDNNDTLNKYIIIRN